MLRIFPFDKTGVSDALVQFERKYKLILPEEYRNFLLKYNGGNTLQTSFKIKKVQIFELSMGLKMLSMNITSSI